MSVRASPRRPCCEHAPLGHSCAQCFEELVEAGRAFQPPVTAEIHPRGVGHSGHLALNGRTNSLLPGVHTDEVEARLRRGGGGCRCECGVAGYAKLNRISPSGYHLLLAGLNAKHVFVALHIHFCARRDCELAHAIPHCDVASPRTSAAQCWPAQH